MQWRQCFLSLWVWVGNGKKGACGKEDGLIEVAFMGEGIPGGQGGCAFLFFLFFFAFSCLDSPEGCRERAGMWARTAFELDSRAQ